MRLPAALGALLLLAALPAPGAGDAHDARWVAQGLAVDPAGGRVLLAEAEWLGLCAQAYRVALRDPATLAVVEERTFPGRQVVTDTPGPPVAPDVFVLSGQSLDPAVAFQVAGAQVVGHNTLALLSQGLTGTYGPLRLALASALAPWSLC